MQSVVIDTNIYIAFMNGSEEVKHILDFTDNVYLPVTVLGELYYGFHKGNRFHENETLLRRFLAKDKVSVLEITTTVAQVYGQLKEASRASGKTVASNDLWIAAICIQNDLSLYSFDSDFRKISTLSRLQ
jgi:tRNA(fMet)-specific endonuclease VapC